MHNCIYLYTYTHSSTSTPSHPQTPQVDRHIQQSVVPVARLSFIGHSLGGIIVRAALTHPLLRQHRAKLHTFCSLGSPHLGYVYTDTILVDGGLWFLKKVKNSTALHQFALTDAKDPRTTFMYRYAYATPLLLTCIRDTSGTDDLHVPCRLSEARGLSDFTHVLLVASPQDGYAPFHSARMQVHSKSLKDSKLGSVHLAMVNNLLQPLQVLHAYATPLLLYMRCPSHGQQPAAAAAGLHTVTEVSRDRVVDACRNRSVSCAPAGGRAFFFLPMSSVACCTSMPSVACSNKSVSCLW